MSFCTNCGKELKGQEKFCTECGTEVQTEEAVDAVFSESNTPKKVARCFSVFGKIGPILGLVSFIIAFIPFVNVFSSQIGPVGIVFSILGKKDAALISSCKRGFWFSLIGTIIGTILYFVYIIMFAYLGIID